MSVEIPEEEKLESQSGQNDYLGAYNNVKKMKNAVKGENGKGSDNDSEGKPQDDGKNKPENENDGKKVDDSNGKPDEKPDEQSAEQQEKPEIKKDTETPEETNANGLNTPNRNAPEGARVPENDGLNNNPYFNNTQPGDNRGSQGDGSNFGNKSTAGNNGSGNGSFNGGSSNAGSAGTASAGGSQAGSIGSGATGEAVGSAAGSTAGEAAGSVAGSAAGTAATSAGTSAVASVGGGAAAGSVGGPVGTAVGAGVGAVVSFRKVIYKALVAICVLIVVLCTAISSFPQALWEHVVSYIKSGGEPIVYLDDYENVADEMEDIFINAIDETVALAETWLVRENASPNYYHGYYGDPWYGMTFEFNSTGIKNNVGGVSVYTLQNIDDDNLYEPDTVYDEVIYKDEDICYFLAAYEVFVNMRNQKIYDDAVAAGSSEPMSDLIDGTFKEFKEIVENYSHDIYPRTIYEASGTKVVPNVWYNFKPDYNINVLEKFRVADSVEYQTKPSVNKSRSLSSGEFGEGPIIILKERNGDIQYKTRTVYKTVENSALRNYVANHEDTGLTPEESNFILITQPGQNVNDFDYWGGASNGDGEPINPHYVVEDTTPALFRSVCSVWDWWVYPHFKGDGLFLNNNKSLTIEPTSRETVKYRYAKVESTSEEIALSIFADCDANYRFDPNEYYLGYDGLTCAQANAQYVRNMLLEFHSRYDGMYINPDKDKGGYRFPLHGDYVLNGTTQKGNLKITSSYGYRNHPITGNFAMHEGIDVVCVDNYDNNVISGLNASVPVYACGKAKVVYVQKTDYGGFGKFVLLEGNDFYSYYAHLDSTCVEIGDEVDNNTIIGYMGTTGDSTGPHLHWQLETKGGETIDPSQYIWLKR